MRRETPRLFQTVGAAMRRAREPNDKLDRATDKTLAEADRIRLCVDCADEAGWRDMEGYRCLKL